MSYININRVELPEPKSVSETLAQTMLLCASVLYDDIVNNSGKGIEFTSKMLLCSIEVLIIDNASRTRQDTLRTSSSTSKPLSLD